VELIDRYVQAVKFWLPRKQQDDITAELMEDIRSQIEEKECTLGCKLSETEVAQLLKQRGRPLLVASRYFPETQQHLIGPLMFPAYRFVIKMVALCYLLPWLLVWIGYMTFNPVYRATHSVIYDILSIGGPFWTTVMMAVGTITIIFAILERMPFRSGVYENWDPLKLRPVIDPNRISRIGSVIEIIANLVCIECWIDSLWSRFVLAFTGTKITLTDQWTTFFWSFLLIAFGNIILSAINLLRPYWTRVRAGLRLLVHIANGAVFCWLLKANILAEISAPKLYPADATTLRNLINTYLDRSFPFAVIACVIAISLADLGRFIRLQARSYTKAS
jgi:hypothetical protein